MSSKKFEILQPIIFSRILPSLLSREMSLYDSGLSEDFCDLDIINTYAAPIIPSFIHNLKMCNGGISQTLKDTPNCQLSRYQYTEIIDWYQIFDPHRRNVTDEEVFMSTPCFTWNQMAIYLLFVRYDGMNDEFGRFGMSKIWMSSL